MIDWLKYFPLQLRDGKSSDSVKGSLFSRARAVTLMPGGNVIRLRAPRHRSDIEESPVYVKGNQDLTRGFRTWRGATENWRWLRLFFRRWTYWREWFGGPVGSLTLSASVMAREEGQALQGSSFFYPRVFEYAIANFLNTTHGVPWTGTVFSWRAPVNWKTHEHLPVFSCSFEVWQGDELTFLYFFFPLSDRHLMMLRFGFTVGTGEPAAQGQTLARQIIDSVQLELSPSSLEELERVKCDIGELSLSEEFAPLKWPIKREEIEQTSPSGPMLSQL